MFHQVLNQRPRNLPPNGPNILHHIHHHSHEVLLLFLLSRIETLFAELPSTSRPWTAIKPGKAAMRDTRNPRTKPATRKQLRAACALLQAAVQL